MLSDVLFEAIDQIRDYQKRMPDVYDANRVGIDATVEVMDALREFYDRLPPENDGQSKEHIAQFWKRFSAAKKVDER